MKVWALLENTAGAPCCRTEHGLSYYIETGAHRILFDAGQSSAFAANARQLGVDLARVDMAVLSHGHSDHGGGLGRFLALNGTAPVYLSRYAFEPHFDAAGRYIGLDPALANQKRLVFTDGSRTIEEGLTLYSGRDLPLAEPIRPFGLTALREGALIPEDFCHEQYLVAEEGGKRILFSGCSHRGILNLMEYFRPDVVFGGFHFMCLDPQGEGAAVLAEAAARLAGYPARYYTGHCTGEEQYRFLKERLGEKLSYLACGQCVRV